MIGNFPASKLYQDLHPFPRIEVKLKLQRKVSLFRHHTGEQQFQARKWNTSTWELYALIREYLSLFTWLFTWSYHQLWTRKWKAAEDKARATLFGYYGLNFAVYTFPPIALAIIGSFFLNLKPRESIRSGKGWKLTAGFSNPLVVNTFLGVLSTLEILAVFLFILFLAWNFYARISNDFKYLKPAKSLMLNSWQLKYLKVETRFGLLAEVCLAFLLFPILRGLALFRLLGIQFEASVRHYLWLGTAMIFFATFHGASTLFIWGVSHFIQEESQLWEWQKTGRIYLAGEICLVTGRETCILSARIFPSKAIELILPKDPGPKYTPTSIIFVKVPSISKYEWHSFSITSSSRVDDNTISIMIKSEGSWTSSLSHMIQTRQESDGDRTKYIPIAVEGPYGTVSMDFLRYDSLLVVSGGIGITPVLSIIQELSSSQNRGINKFLPRMQLIYVVKKSQDICLLNSISPLIFGQPAEKCLLKVKVFVTQEEQSDATHLCRPCYKMEKAKETDSSYPPKTKQSFRKKGQHKQVMLLRNMKSILEAGLTLKFPDETGGSDIGVLVYGPETMKESVALICQKKCGAKKQNKK
ncbi:unnamed protein product [Prunus armeniaca]